MARRYPRVSARKRWVWPSHIDDDKNTQPEPDVTTAEGIEQEPRGNPEPDAEAVEKGEEVLGRVKPY
jgi:hypothetical protein